MKSTLRQNTSDHDPRQNLADLTLARGGPTLATLVRPRSEDLFAKTARRGKNWVFVDKLSTIVDDLSTKTGVRTLFSRHGATRPTLAGLVPICPRGHFSRFDPKVPHFSRKYPRVAAARPLLVRGPSHWRRESAGPPFSRLSRPGEHLTHQPLLAPLRKPKPRPIIHEHLTSRRPSPEQRPARCWPAGAPARVGQSTRRGMISPPMKCSTSTGRLVPDEKSPGDTRTCVSSYGASLALS